MTVDLSMEVLRCFLIHNQMMDGKATSVMCWSGNTVPYFVLWSGKVGHEENAGGGPQVQGDCQGEF